MSDQINRDITEQDVRRGSSYSVLTDRHDRNVRRPSFSFGDMVAFALILAMVWGPLAMGALRA
jgi:hypothetical protein